MWFCSTISLWHVRHLGPFLFLHSLHCGRPFFSKNAEIEKSFVLQSPHRKHSAWNTPLSADTAYVASDSSMLRLHSEHESLIFSLMIVGLSKQFEKATHVSFPTSANRCHTLLDAGATTAAELDSHARAAHIVLHAQLLPLFEALLALKRSSGAERSRQFFRGIPDADGLIVRAMRDRPLAFVGRRDAAVLRNGFATAGDAFLHIGTDDEDANVPLDSYQTYDEMLLSALLLVSGPVIFINDGKRDNLGRAGERGSFERDGIFVGAVGARCERDDANEALFIVLDKARSTPANGYGAAGSATGRFAPLLRLMAPLYGVEHFPSFDEALAAGNDARFVALKSGRILDALMFARRIRVTIDSILLEAERRGADARRQVHLRIPGLGLGVWAVSKAVQNRVFVEQVAEAVRALRLPHVDVLSMMWFDDGSQTSTMRDGTVLRDAASHAVKVEFGQISPSEPVHGGRLLVAVFAWDGNSIVGNEYWSGALAASSDPAAAASSTLPEMLNPLINDNLTRAQSIRILT